MLDNEKSIDAVIVATPDHFHAVAAMAAMRRGKHVYVQKPLTRLVGEARALTEAARKYKVVTQMGNQATRATVFATSANGFGPASSVTSRRSTPGRTVQSGRKASIARKRPRRFRMDWIGIFGSGPSPMRPYHPCYLPFNWRGWWDFGGGALADMACHVLDPVFWSLKLKYPTSVEASCTPVNNETFPLGSIVRYEFRPARTCRPSRSTGTTAA